jgi:phosphocarrier protein HPr
MAVSGSGDDRGPVVRRTVTIQNRRGLHARAAVKLVKMVGQFSAEVTVGKGGQTVSGSSILGLMMLAAATGNEVEITARGPDAEAALDAICKMVDGKFDEE